MLACFLFCFMVCWDNPTTNTDGTPLEDLEAVKIYVGSSPGQYDTRLYTKPTTEPGIQLCTNIKVSPGQYWVAGTAINSEGEESDFSNEVEVTEERVLPTPSGGRLETPTGGSLIIDG